MPINPNHKPLDQAEAALSHLNQNPCQPPIKCLRVPLGQEPTELLLREPWSLNCSTNGDILSYDCLFGLFNSSRFS